MTASNCSTSSPVETALAMGFDYDAMPKEHVAACNMCGGVTGDRIACEDRYGFKIGLFACFGCGLIQLSPRMTAEGYADFYGRGVYRAIAKAMFGKTKTTGLGKLQRGYANGLSDRFGDTLERTRGGKLLDIGGSIGLTASMLCERYGLEGLVLEPSADEIAQVPSGLAAEQTLFESWDDGGRKFDVVLMLQTVDHLLDIRGTLARIRSLLNPGGVFIMDSCEYAAVADIAGMVYALKIDHVYYLNEAVTACYLRRAGLPYEYVFSAHSGRKRFFCCGVGEPIKAIPKRPAVWQVFANLKRWSE